MELKKVIRVLRVFSSFIYKFPNFKKATKSKSIKFAEAAMGTKC